MLTLVEADWLMLLRGVTGYLIVASLVIAMSISDHGSMAPVCTYIPAPAALLLWNWEESRLTNILIEPTTNLNDQPVGINWLDGGSTDVFYKFLSGSTNSIIMSNSTNQ